jgi:hypothetical protein
MHGNSFAKVSGQEQHARASEAAARTSQAGDGTKWTLPAGQTNRRQGNMNASRGTKRNARRSMRDERT